MEKKKFGIVFSSRSCKACWECIGECPVHAIVKVKFLWHKHAKHLSSRCVGCGRCVRACPEGCFTISSK